ncbi:GGDEF domain-containing protein [Clostridium sp. UBA4548]|uniref:GGDEF domain-containing protein n=1 Tax=Clostridium sp. UBA4548 TaxID=1946361 RepID=UPI0025B813E9|nr:GGDEF domain-containing protein [Clostridium sp. UBA4548]
MIKKVFDIIEKKLMKIDVLNGTKKIQDIFHQESIECFTVYDEYIMVGVITKDELVGAHPNRIAEDVMSHKYIVVNYDMCIWEVKQIFDYNKKVSIVLVEKEGQVIGYVTRSILDIELGKHLDSLTGLYKKEYMFYHAFNFIRQGKNATIIFLDLNNFGCIDKKYGHIVGDMILKGVADILKNCLEDDSYLCRYAGDEFAIVSSNSSNDCKLLAENIVKTIEEYPFFNNIPVSAAVGITGGRMKFKEVEEIFVFLNDLVNVASLASTKAKKDITTPVVIKNIDETA